MTSKSLATFKILNSTCHLLSLTPWGLMLMFLTDVWVKVEAMKVPENI